MPEAFSQDDLDAAVAAATGPLQKRLAELEAQVQETEVGKAVAEAVATEAARTAELQTQLDKAEAARTAAENRLAETEQFWTQAIAEHQAAAELESRREQRIAQATDAGVFAEDYVLANADRFAAMSDEDFNARLAEWALIASKAPATTTPATTALTASKTESTATASQLGLLGELTTRRIDPRALGGK